MVRACMHHAACAAQGHTHIDRRDVGLRGQREVGEEGGLQWPPVGCEGLRIPGGFGTLSLDMATLVLGDPPELQALRERRRRAGADRHDEVWEGVLHMTPEPSGAHLYVQQQLAEVLGPLARAAGLVPGIGGFNLGSETDYRAPDGGLFRSREFGVWHRTAALVLEIVSPRDETWSKLAFYAAHQGGRVADRRPAGPDGGLAGA